MSEEQRQTSIVISIIKAVFYLLFFGYGLVQIYLGFAGITHHLGIGWAIAALVVLIMGLPVFMSVGAFYGAMHVWGGHWIGALAFVAPGGLVMTVTVPMLLISIAT